MAGEYRWCWPEDGSSRFRNWPPNSAVTIVLAVTCDVGEVGPGQAMTAAALEKFGRIDAVFANAGFGATRGFLPTPEQWKSMILTSGSVRHSRSAPPSPICSSEATATS